MSEQIGFKPIPGLNETSLIKIIEMSGKELAEKSYVDAAVSNVTVDTTNLATKSELGAKVDKEEGKGLRTEDFTTEYKNKLEGLSNTGISDEQISTAVNNYLTEHPVSSGATTEQVAQIQANKNDIADIINNKLDGKTFKFLTQAEYDVLSESEKNNETIEYHITDATENSHTHTNKEVLDKISEDTDGSLLFNGNKITSG